MQFNPGRSVFVTAMLFGAACVCATAAEAQHGDRHAASRPIDQQYSMEQAISDQAQLHTIAFNGLAFLTGDFGAATFMPPGKVCDFFGFQYMRDIDEAKKGHNPMFLNCVVGNVLHVLNADQKQIFLKLADEQAPQLEALARMRLPLIKAFYMQSDRQIPPGSPGLNQAAAAQYVGTIFERDAELSLRRADAMAQVARSLSTDQKTYLAKMKFNDFNTWPALDERGAHEDTGKGKSQLFNVAYMTYASEFFSWTAGSLDADTYFCPERHGTYFGGFYMKDMPAMGKRDYDISTSRTGDSGAAFVDQVLTPTQRAIVAAIPDQQRAMLQECISVRRSMAQEFRKYLQGQTPDRAKVLQLGRRYGELDGSMSYLYAMAFAKVNATLTAAQRQQLMKLRNLDGYKSAPYYIYSHAMEDTPDTSSATALFFAPKMEKPS